MSTFSADFINTRTSEIRKVLCIDDYFGRRQYGYHFFDADKELEFVLNEEEMYIHGWEMQPTMI